MKYTTEQLIKDHYSEHVARWEPFGPNTLRWGKPDSGISCVLYRIEGPMLFVWGDLGEAVYQWSRELSFKWLAGCSLDYFASKCQASEEGRGYRRWEKDVAVECIERWIADALGDGDKHEVELLRNGAVESVENAYEWWRWVDGDGGERYERFWEAGDIGLTISNRCVLQLEGLKRAVAAVEGDDAD